MTSKLLSEKMAQHMKQEIDKIKAELIKNESVSQATIKQKRNTKRGKSKTA